MGNIQILIIDDNKSHLKLEKLILSDSSYDIHTATDANEAMKLLTEIHPRLILMDIQIPGMNGLELTKKLKANPKCQDIIIVAMTAYASEEDKREALNAGFNGYLTKPIDTEKFPQLIAEYIEKNDTK